MSRTIRYTKDGPIVIDEPDTPVGERNGGATASSGANEVLESFFIAGMPDGANTAISDRDANVVWLFSLHWKSGPCFVARRAADPYQGSYYHPGGGKAVTPRFPIASLAPEDMPKVMPPCSQMLMRGPGFCEQYVRTNAIPAEATEYRQELTGGKGEWKAIPDWWR